MATMMWTDTDIQQDVLDEFVWDPEVEAAEVGVEVDDGVVTLTGTVESYLMKLAAEKAAQRVEGVRAVANDLSVRGPLTHNDTDIAKEAADALERNYAVPPDRVEITVQNGKITLRGEVDWSYQRTAAANSVRSLRGARDNLLALTDITAGRLRASLEPVLLEPLITRVAAEFGSHSPTHPLTAEVAPALPPAEADADLLEEVLRNLYENAVKYAPDGGAIRTSAVAENDAVVIRVADEGIGIAPEHVATVFERFRRVGGDGRVRGMGLGLYLCRGLVEAQGGRIEVSSPGLGQGATFTVTLPVARGWAESEPA